MTTSITPSIICIIFLCEITVINVCSTEPVKLVLNGVYNKNDSTKSMAEKVLKSRSIRSSQPCTVTYEEKVVLGVFRKNLLNEINCSRRNLNFFPSISYDTPEDTINITNNILFDLSYNAVEKLERKNFKNLYFIVRLLLTHNQIENISEDAFYDLHRLKRLDLSYNNISKLEYNTFSLNKNITKLSLKKNRIKSINDNLFNGLTELIKIDVSANEIDYISSDAFSSNRKLQEISLNGNKLTHLIVNIEVFPLTRLNIHNNPWRCNCNFLHNINNSTHSRLHNNSDNTLLEPYCPSSNYKKIESLRHMLRNDKILICPHSEETEIFYNVVSNFIAPITIATITILIVTVVIIYFKYKNKRTIPATCYTTHTALPPVCNPENIYEEIV